MIHPQLSAVLRNVLVTMGLTCLPGGHFAQSTFQRSVAGQYSSSGNFVLTDGGGSTILGTFSPDAATYDLFSLRLSALGDTLWTRSYGSSELMFGTCLDTVGNGGLYICAQMRNTADDYTGLLMRADVVGDILWSKRIYGPDMVFVGAIATCADGGSAIGGHSMVTLGTPITFLVRTGANGDTLWTRSYSGIGVLHDLVELPDGGFMTLAEVLVSDTMQQVLMRTDALGHPNWARSIRTADGTGVEFNDLLRTPNGHWILAGDHYSSTASEGLLVELDSLGQLVWATRLAGTSYVTSLRQAVSTTDDGTLVSGLLNCDYWTVCELLLAKVDTTGSLVWSRSFTGGGFASGNSASPTLDGGFVASGFRITLAQPESNAYIIKTDSLGHGDCWEQQPNLTTMWLALVMDTLLVGEAPSGLSVSPFAITMGPAMTTSDPCQEVGLWEHGQASEITTYPNPTDGPITIRGLTAVAQIRILDPQGKELRRYLGSGSSMQLDLSGLANGIYFLVVNEGDRLQSRTLCIHR